MTVQRAEARGRRGLVDRRVRVDPPDSGELLHMQNARTFQETTDRLSPCNAARFRDAANRQWLVRLTTFTFPSGHRPRTR
jgi:hypothetical protein